MKRIVALLLALVVLSLCACSGNKTEEVSESPVSTKPGLAGEIVGSWVTSNDVKQVTWTLYDDMTYTRSEIFLTPPEMETTFEGRYEINGDKISVYSDLVPTSIYAVTINGNSMSWEYIENGSVMNFTRK